MKGKGSQREIADMWAEAKENEPELVAFLKIQAIKKNNGEEWTHEMPESESESGSESESEHDSDKSDSD